MTTGAPPPTDPQDEPDPLGLMDVIELVAPQARVTGWERLRGGLAGGTYRIDVAMPSGAQTAFVLRRVPSEHDAGGRLTTRLAATLEALRETLVAAPEVLWLDADGVVFGRPAIATTLLPGRVRSGEVAGSPEVLRGLAEALVTLRWAPVDQLDHLPRREDPTALAADLRGPLPASDLVDTRAVADALLAHVGRVGARAQPGWSTATSTWATCCSTGRAPPASWTGTTPTSGTRAPTSPTAPWTWPCWRGARWPTGSSPSTRRCGASWPTPRGGACRRRPARSPTRWAG